jgi:hypothetical protein
MRLPHAGYLQLMAARKFDAVVRVTIELNAAKPLQFGLLAPDHRALTVK